VIGDVEVRHTHDRGAGVFARRSFVRGELILRRTHTPIAASAIDQLPAGQREHVCQVDVDRFAVVASPGCFVNHCCQPNALRRGVRVVAWSPIDAGDEITLDYRLNALDGPPWECRCGAQACTGLVEGGFFSFDAGRQRELLRFAGDFVRNEHHRRNPP
jgi:hypothetical protein